MGHVLITGAFGFVGTNLSVWLAERGRGVWALDVAGAGSASGGAYGRLFTWDDLERVPWGEVDAVVHLAGKAHDTQHTSDPQSYFDINAGLTEKIVRRIADAAPRPIRFILFSSVKASADAVDGVLTEDAAPDPHTPYGKSKLEAERIVREAAAARPEALCGLILRPCMIHGPGNKGNLNLLYTLVRKGAPWPLGAFDNQRSFASIGNVCAVVEGVLAGKATASGIYQVADDETLSTNELITLMAGALGRPVRIWRVPAAWIRLSARLGDTLRLPLNSERLRKLTESYVVSNRKLKAMLGWKSMPVTTGDGLRLTLETMALT